MDALNNLAEVATKVVSGINVIAEPLLSLRTMLDEILEIVWVALS